MSSRVTTDVEYGKRESFGIALAGIFCSLCISNLMKYIYTVGYPYPLFVTSLHMGVSYFVSRWAIFTFKLSTEFRQFSGKDQLQKILPICLCQVLSVGCNNLALLFIFPSFVVILGTSLPLFTLVFGVWLGTEAYNRYSIIAVAMILFGSMASAKTEANFHLLGFVLMMLCVALRAFKQVMQARLLRASDRVDALTLLYYVTPQNFVAFFLWSLVNNGIEPFAVLLEMPLQTWILILFSAVVASCFNVVAFLGVRILNATTWSLIGQMVSPLTITVSHLVFGNEITPSQMVCFAISGAGVLMYQTKGKVKKARASVTVVNRTDDQVEKLGIELGNLEDENADEGVCMEEQTLIMDQGAKVRIFRSDLSPIHSAV